MKIDKAKTRESSNIKDDGINKRISIYTESYKGEYYNIDVNKLIPFKNQYRKRFDQKSIEELAQTIKLHGIRQPLTILPSEESEGKYEIVSGERRWRAAMLVGLLKVPCIILQDKNTAEEIALIENVQRKNLHPLELMQGFQSLLDKGICNSHQEIADKIGITRTIVVETLALSKLSYSTQSLLLEKNIKSRKILRQLLKAPPAEHKRIIIGEEEQKKKLLSKKVGYPKHKLISIYVQSENLIFDTTQKLNLTLEQKTQLKEYLKNILEKL